MVTPVPTVIRVDRGEHGNLICKLVSAPNAPADGQYYPFQLRAYAGASPPIKAEGEAIWEALNGASQGIASALAAAMGVSTPSVSPIVIEPFATMAEQVRWEVLYEARRKFVALDRCWPVTRKAQREFPVELLETEFAPPLKILAVCSATGVPADPEWDALFAAASAAVQAGLPVDLVLVTGDAALRRRVQAEKDLARLPWVSLTGVPDTAAELENIIATHAPHVVHFFCHGLVDSGGAWLVVQTLIPGVSLKLSIEILVGMRALRETWLVVLNSCLSGMPSANVPSMAYRLVAGGGVPAVVGNLEPVEANDAHAMTAGFYGNFIRRFTASFAAAGDDEVVPIDLAQALGDARERIGAGPDRPHDWFDEWAKPVLYVRDTPFAVRKKDDAARAGVAARPMPSLKPAVVSMIGDLLASLPPSTPPELRQKLVEAIIANAAAG